MLSVERIEDAGCHTRAPCASTGRPEGGQAERSCKCFGSAASVKLSGRGAGRPPPQREEMRANPVALSRLPAFHTTP